MKFQPGDKVSFINEKQNGTIIRILSPTMVLVEIEDGFEIQVQANELVKIQSSSEKPTQQQLPLKEKTVDEEPVQNDEVIISIAPANALSIGVLPAKTGAVLTGPVKFVLVNTSAYSFQFTLLFKSGKSWRGIHADGIDQNKVINLYEGKREDLIDVTSLLLQALPFSEAPQNHRSVLTKESALLFPDLDSGHQHIKGLEAFTKFILVHSFVEIEEPELKDLIEKFEQKQIKKDHKSIQRSKSEDYENRGIFLNEKTVDLHIEELVNDITQLNNTDMINIQLKHFMQQMDEAIRKHYKRIIFIHGKGKGKLKEEIRKELRNYPGVAFRDADVSRFGGGATEVIFT